MADVKKTIEDQLRVAVENILEAYKGYTVNFTVKKGKSDED